MMTAWTCRPTELDGMGERSRASGWINRPHAGRLAGWPQLEDAACRWCVAPVHLRLGFSTGWSFRTDGFHGDVDVTRSTAAMLSHLLRPKRTESLTCFLVRVYGPCPSTAVVSAGWDCRKRPQFFLFRNHQGKQNSISSYFLSG